MSAPQQFYKPVSIMSSASKSISLRWLSVTWYMIDINFQGWSNSWGRSFSRGMVRQCLNSWASAWIQIQASILSISMSAFYLIIAMRGFDPCNPNFIKWELIKCNLSTHNPLFVVFWWTFTAISRSACFTKTSKCMLDFNLDGCPRCWNHTSHTST